MTVSAVDANTISVLNTETDGFGQLLNKTYNFEGYVMSTKVAAQSPLFEWPIHIFDTCAAYYEMVWSSFSEISIDIGSMIGDSQTRAFTQTLKAGQSIQTPINCGGGTFNVSLSGSTPINRATLENLIHVTSTQNENLVIEVTLSFDAVNQLSMEGNYDVTVTGQLALHTQSSYATTFRLNLVNNCQYSQFPDPPVLKPASEYYYYIGSAGGQDEILIDVRWRQDTLSAFKGVNCSDYRILITLNNQESQLSTAVDQLVTTATQTGANEFKFKSTQLNLVGSRLVYDIEIMSDNISDRSQTSQFIVNILGCDELLPDQSWIEEIVETIRYDLRSPPPTSNIISVRAYNGPPVEACGNPQITFLGGGTSLAFLSQTYDAITNQITIRIIDQSQAVEGQYEVDADFTQLGQPTFITGLKLEVYDRCKESQFNSAPMLFPTSDYYYAGQGDIFVEVTWQLDTASFSSGVSCGGYQILITLNTGQSTLVNSVDLQVTTAVQTDTTQQIRFASTQSNLAGSILIYDVKIGSTNIIAQSPSAQYTVTILACTEAIPGKNWIESIVETKRYDLRSPPPQSNIITVRDYSGPPVSACGNLQVVFKSSGLSISFLSYSFDQVTNKITVTIPDQSQAVEGSYDNIFAEFSNSAGLTFSTGLTLQVYDRCKESLFPQPPSIKPIQVYYYIGQGDVLVGVTWQQDTAFALSGTSCEGYQILLSLNTSLSNLTNPVTADTVVTQTSSNQFKFSSTQANLASSTLAYDVKIGSTNIVAQSASTPFIVNIIACDELLPNQSWIEEIIETIRYDLRSPPPASNIITIRNYLGPPREACGNPVITSKSSDQAVAFLSQTYDAITNQITISITDQSQAVEGSYEIDAAFSQPGIYTFITGLTLEVYDRCKESLFNSAPMLSPISDYYYAGQGDIFGDVTWQPDTAFVQSGVSCGGYQIIITLNTGQSTLVNSVDFLVTTAVQTDTTQQIKFASTQSNLAGSILIYDVKIGSTNIVAQSPSAQYTVTILACTEAIPGQNWIESIVETKRYDLRSPPPQSNIIAVRDYSGPPVSACGNLQVQFTSSGLAISFLSQSFDGATKKITIIVPDQSQAVEGTYNDILAQFSNSAGLIFATGLTLQVYDRCEESTFPAAPMITPQEIYYYIGQGDFVVGVTWQEDTASAQSGTSCGGYQILLTTKTDQTVLTNLIVEAQTFTQQLSDSEFKFTSTQKNLVESTITYEVKIGSDQIMDQSDTSLFVVNIVACNELQPGSNWIDEIVNTLMYDRSNPPVNGFLATRSYNGPPISACGEPQLTFSTDDFSISIFQPISFLSFDFIQGTGEIQIIIPEASLAIPGTYDSIDAEFSQPGVQSFPTGLTLIVQDSCEDSTIQTNGVYLEMRTSSQQTDPSSQSLFTPTVMYASGNSELNCGGISYEILSAVSETDPQVSLGSLDFYIDQTTQKLILNSDAYGQYEVIVRVSFTNYPAIYSDSNTFLVEVVDCGEISLTPLDVQQPTTVIYNLYDAKVSWSYLLEGRFDICDPSKVSFSLRDIVASQSAPAAVFTSDYIQESTTITLSVETSDRSFLGNYPLVLSFTQPGIKTIPPTGHLLDVRIADPCNADIWSNLDFGVVSYTFADPELTQDNGVPNSLNVDFCEFEVIEVTDDWNNPPAVSQIVTTTNTNTTITLKIQTDDNSSRQQVQTVNVFIKMKSPYYANTWEATFQLAITDPCYENTVEALSDKTEFLSESITFSTTAVDSVSTTLNKPGYCGISTPQSMTCTGLLMGKESISAQNNSAAITLNWDRTLIAQTSCRVTYATEYSGKTWLGDSFSVSLTDPCLSEQFMLISTEDQIIFDQQEFTYELCQTEESFITFSYDQDPLSVLSNIPDFCGDPEFSLKKGTSGLDYTQTNLKVVGNLNGTGKLSLPANMCQRFLLGSYTVWLERKYKSNQFITGRSPDLTYKMTDPCPPITLSNYQTFFTPNNSPYLYLIGETAPIPFNITGGYYQDNLSNISNTDYYCGYPTFSYKVLLYSDQSDATPAQQQWLSLVEVPNEFSSYDGKDIILQIDTTSTDQTGIYHVYMVVSLDSMTKFTYTEFITVQVTGDPCAITYWNDSSFGTVDYTIGELLQIPQPLTNSRNLKNCQTQILSFTDEENTTQEWFSNSTTSSSDFTLSLYLNNTERADFWYQTQPWGLSITYLVKSVASQLPNFIFTITASINFVNPCLTDNSVTALSPFTFLLAQQVKFYPDLSTVMDKVSQTYGIQGLCGNFTAETILCNGLPQVKTVIVSSEVQLQLDWNRNFIGDFQCVVTYYSTKGSMYRSVGAVVWPGDSSQISLTDPCSTSTYMPLDFSQTTSLNITYEICQSIESVLNFDFTDSLSTITQQDDFCGAPILDFSFSDQNLQSISNLTGSVKVFYEQGQSYLKLLPKMCERFYNKQDGSVVMLNITTIITVEVNCAQCTGAPYTMNFFLELKDPCQNTNIVDQQIWYDALPQDVSQSPVQTIDVKQSSVIQNLTAGYQQDSVTASIGIPVFCGAPVYKLEVFNQQAQTVTQQLFANITAQPLVTSLGKSYILSLQTDEITTVGNYSLVITTYLEPGQWKIKQYAFKLIIINPCELQYFNFYAANPTPIVYSISNPRLEYSHPYSNSRNAIWCEVVVLEEYQDMNSDGAYQQVSTFASSTADNNLSQLNISVYSLDTTARVQSQTYYLGLTISNSFVTQPQLFKNIAQVNLIDPCFGNSVLAQQSLVFDLAKNITFLPDTVSDSYSQSINQTGLCGTQLQAVTFSCFNFSSEDAYYDTIKGKAFVNLNWDTGLINTTLRCKFNYNSADYNEVWPGQYFNVDVTDPCIKEEYMLITTNDSIVFELQEFTYELCQTEESFLLFTYTKDPLSALSQIPDICGSPIFSINQNTTDPKYVNYTPTNLEIVYNLNGTGKLTLPAKMCQRILIGNYTVWLERRYRSNQFITGRSPDLTYTMTDPCPPITLSDYQTFFTPNKSPYAYLIGETAPIPFNITGGYYQDNLSNTSNTDYYCGYPTFSFKVKLYSDQSDATPAQQQWLSLVEVPNQFSSYDGKDIILQIETASSSQNGIYRVYVVANLDSVNKFEYSEFITVQVTDDACAITKWNSLAYGEIIYTIGSFNQVQKPLTNSRGLANCETRILSFKDSEQTTQEWFSNSTTSPSDFTLSLYLNNTERADFWYQAQPFGLSVTYQVKSAVSQLPDFIFTITASINFINPCLTDNSVTALSPFTFLLAQQVKFYPDLSTVVDKVSKTYGIQGLCGNFTAKSILCGGLPQEKTVIVSQEVQLQLDWNRNFIGDFQCVASYYSTRGSMYRSVGAVVWPGDSSQISLTDPCSTSTYMPLVFSQNSSFTLIYEICQSNVSVLNFDFTDSLSTITQQNDFCGAPILDFSFQDQNLQSISNLTSSVKLFYESGQSYLNLLPKMCERFYNQQDGSVVMLNTTTTITVEVNCAQCTGAPWKQNFTVKFNDPCQFADLVDQQAWYDALPKDLSQSPVQTIDVRQSGVIQNLTAGYQQDNVTAQIGIPVFCGAPLYKLEVFNQQAQKVTNQLFANVTAQPLMTSLGKSYNLSLQTDDITTVGNYSLVITTYLEPGQWKIKQYAFKLIIINPCELQYFNFYAANPTPIVYSISNPRLEYSQPYSNNRNAVWCEVVILEEYQDKTIDGAYQQVSTFANSTADNNLSQLNISVYSLDTTARVQSQTYYLGLTISNSFVTQPQLFKNIAQVNLIDPCFGNTVLAQSPLVFDLAKNITFLPDTVSDSYSSSINQPGLCGTQLQAITFSCLNFGSENAYYDTIRGKAFVNLNWDISLINTTLRCKFDYNSADYNEVWPGQYFDVNVTDPCLKNLSYQVQTSNGTNYLDYELGRTPLQFQVWFQSSLDIESGVTNFCGSIASNLTSNRTTSSFLNQTFNSTNNTYQIRVASKSAADLGFYSTSVYVSLDNYGLSQLAGNYILRLFSDNPCGFATIQPLVLETQDYYVWQPPLNSTINVTDDCPACNCSWLLRFTSQPQNSSDFLTLNFTSGNFSIYTNDTSSVSTEFRVSNITVEFEHFPVTGSVTGLLKYRIHEPCLANIGIVTFTYPTNQSIVYNVCQNQSVVFGYFTYKDTLSDLTSIPNYCGNPTLSLAPLYSYPQKVTNNLKINSSQTDNSGYLNFSARMCERKFGSLSYQFYIQLFYKNGNTTTNSKNSVNIQINDPCYFTQSAKQTFFGSQKFKISTYSDEPRIFNLSAAYQADNVTIWSGLDTFCGEYPRYEAIVIQQTNTSLLLYNSSQNSTLNKVNFTTLINSTSHPPDNYTLLVLNSTDNRDCNQYYTVFINMQDGLQNFTENTTLSIQNACASSTMVEFTVLRDLNYTIGQQPISASFFYTADTVSQFFKQEKNYDLECGYPDVICQVLGNQQTSFLSLEKGQGAKIIPFTYSIFTNSSSDVGEWNVLCSASLNSYPDIDPILQVFKVIIKEAQSTLPATVQSECVGSSDVRSCEQFADSNPPYFATYPDSSTQFQAPSSSYSIPIVNVYVQYANVLSLSTIAVDTQDEAYVDQYLRIDAFAEDAQFQNSIGDITTTQSRVNPVTVEFYCAKEQVNSLITIEIDLRWKGVFFVQNSYTLPIFCMPCNSDVCSENSKDFYATLDDWKKKYHPPKPITPSPPPPPPIVVKPQPPVYEKKVQISSGLQKPIDRSDPSIQLPTATGGTYLDFSFNSFVPVRLANGQIVQVKMCAPNVESISNTGRVSIVFSKDIEQINPAAYQEIENSGVIQAQLILGSELGISNQDLAEQAYSFNFTVQETTSTHVYIQIIFEQPEAISSSSTSKDRIQITFVNSGTYFKCQTSLPQSLQSGNSRKLQTAQAPSADVAVPNGFTVSFELPPQVDPVRGQKLDKTVNYIAGIANWFIFIAVLLSLKFNFRLDMLWGCINALQILAFLSYTNVAWPANISFLFSIINQIAQFDLLDPFSPMPLSQQYIADWNWSPTDPKGSSIAIQNGGSLTFLPNLGSVALFLLIALIYTLIAFIIRLLMKINILGRTFRLILQKLRINGDKLLSQWFRIFLETFIVLYMYLLLGFQMAKQLPANTRTASDKWSIATQSIMIVPILGFPFVIMWFAFFHIRWFVSFHKIKFFLGYQEKLQQEKLQKEIERQSKEGELNRNETDKLNDQQSFSKKADVENQYQTLVNLIQNKASPKKEKSIVVDFNDQIEIEAEGPAEQKQQSARESRRSKRSSPDSRQSSSSKRKSFKSSISYTGEDAEVASLMMRLVNGVRCKVKFNLKERIKAMSARHSELEDQQKGSQNRLKSYDKFATLHKELNHHSYTSQYFWVVFLLRRIVFITICTYTNDSYWHSSFYLGTSMFVSAYLYAIFPFKYARKNYVENFNELVVFTCAVLQMILAGYSMDPNIGSDQKGRKQSVSTGAATRQTIANFVIAAISFVIALNTFTTVADLYHQVSLNAKRLYARYKVSQGILKKEERKKDSRNSHKSNQSEQPMFDHLSLKDPNDIQLGEPQVLLVGNAQIQLEESKEYSENAVSNTNLYGLKKTPTNIFQDQADKRKIQTPNDTSVEVSRIDGYYPGAMKIQKNLAGRDLDPNDSSVEVSRIDGYYQGAMQINTNFAGNSLTPNDSRVEISRIDGYSQVDMNIKKPLAARNLTPNDSRVEVSRIDGYSQVDMNIKKPLAARNLTPNDSRVEVSRIDYNPREGIELVNVLGRQIEIIDNSGDVSRVDNLSRSARRVQKNIVERDYTPTDESCEVSRIEEVKKRERIFDSPLAPRGRTEKKQVLKARDQLALQNENQNELRQSLQVNVLKNKNRKPLQESNYVYNNLTNKAQTTRKAKGKFVSPINSAAVQRGSLSKPQAYKQVDLDQPADVTIEDENTPLQSRRNRLGEMELQSVDSESIQYIDTARHRLNDTYKYTKSQRDFNLSNDQLEEDGPSEYSEEEQMHANQSSFGEDFQGDLRSHRVFNQNQLSSQSLDSSSQNQPIEINQARDSVRMKSQYERVPDKNKRDVSALYDSSPSISDL